ncbi:MAG: hypothetical protein L3K18_09720 [Thermoplasmata archaeon]|nr:hypothetical protein [Thermoplasmata archaeon]
MKGTWHESLKVVVDILIPVGAGIAGFFTCTAVFGGVNAMYNVLLKAGISGNAGRLADLVMSGISAAIGFGFWRLGHTDGMILKIVGRGVGAFFLGGAASYLAQAWTQPSNVPNGLVDKLVGNFQTLASET